jgi:uncharacterized membrane protein
LAAAWLSGVRDAAAIKNDPACRHKPASRILSVMDYASDILFETVLRPNPPLSPRVLKHLLAVVVLFNLAFAGFFLARGAWPIAPFLGLDVALLAWAFRSSTRAARREERLRLSREVLHIERQPEQTETALNPYWLQVETAPASGVLLWSHGRATWIGRFLGPEASAALSVELRDALWRAKNY